MYVVKGQGTEFADISRQGYPLDAEPVNTFRHRGSQQQIQGNGNGFSIFRFLQKGDLHPFVERAQCRTTPDLIIDLPRWFSPVGPI